MVRCASGKAKQKIYNSTTFHCVVITAFISCLCIGHVRAQSQPHTVAEVRTFDLVYAADVHSLPSERKDVAIWIPLPQSDDHQDILDLRTI